ncbi:PaaI family thioesterase [Roseivirga sp. UBA1976]|uniref:PaaI family thioesterase n=1 Tax=Roseivirga sp. UBA1976 TaxID=1947386 RepID=UPI002580B0CE|nr:PaaI family thioesterase [Roseivirga sp. UBA1976]MEC7752621.1 PaaI family thioesterase [Bacteroidota bacterium]|tara:strand:+ start:1244 stop:1699 length:456 start_codon:yes stop_codon:yes gene_type:complete
MVKVFNQNYKARIEKFLERQHFMKLVGFDLNVIDEGRTEGWLELREEHQQQTGLVHGGVTATVADIVAGFSAYTVVAEDQHVVTGEIKISYFAPGRGQKLYAKGWVVKQGKKMNFCEAEVWCIDGEKRTLIAKATTTMVTLFSEDVAKRKS